MKIYLIRHGETAWSRTDKHTGLTDVPLIDEGRKQAAALKPVLQKCPFVKVFCSPLKRALETCDLAGFATQKQIDPDLVEWDYGKYEGLTTAEICATTPQWQLFRDGPLGGESLQAISARADRVLKKAANASGDVALFSSAHFLRVCAARWIGLSATDAKFLQLAPASVSILGHEHDYPCILLWNWSFSFFD